jgi:hypothetical protein
MSIISTPASVVVVVVVVVVCGSAPPFTVTRGCLLGCCGSVVGVVSGGVLRLEDVERSPSSMSSSEMDAPGCRLLLCALSSLSLWEGEVVVVPLVTTGGTRLSDSEGAAFISWDGEEDDVVVG